MPKNGKRFGFANGGEGSGVGELGSEGGRGQRK